MLDVLYHRPLWDSDESYRHTFQGEKNAYKKNYYMFIKFQVTQLCLRSYELSMISQIHWWLEWNWMFRIMLANALILTDTEGEVNNLPSHTNLGLRPAATLSSMFPFPCAATLGLTIFSNKEQVSPCLYRKKGVLGKEEPAPNSQRRKYHLRESSENIFLATQKFQTSLSQNPDASVAWSEVGKGRQSLSPLASSCTSSAPSLACPKYSRAPQHEVWRSPVNGSWSQQDLGSRSWAIDLASSHLFPHLSNGHDHQSPAGRTKHSMSSLWCKHWTVNHWADASYNLDLGYLKPQSPKVFLELLSSNDLRHDWCLEATQAAQIAVTASYLFPEGRLTKLTHIPREC